MDSDGICQDIICAIGANILDENGKKQCICPNDRTNADNICGDCVSTKSYQAWTQPIMRSNTTCNQDVCGSLSASSVYASYHAAWYAFNGIKSGQDKYLGADRQTEVYIVWHLPVPLKVSSCKFFQTYESAELKRFPQYLTVFGSNDGQNWTKIGDNTGYSLPGVGAHITVACDSTSVYNYLKFHMQDKDSQWMDDGRLIAVQEIEISAQAEITTSKTLNPDTLLCE